MAKQKEKQTKEKQKEKHTETHHAAHHDNYDEKYTDPELRRRLKDEIMASDKGGEPGQWSARKSQLLVREYEQQGGGYKTNEKDEAARSLEEWSEQDWQTEAGDDRAREGNVTQRYLPKEVWEKLTDKEKEEAERTKEEASKHGEQHAGYTDAIKRALHEVEAEHHPAADEKDAKDAQEDTQEKGTGKKSAKKKQSEKADKRHADQKQSGKKQSEVKQSEKADKKQSQQQGKSDDSEHSLSQKELYEQAKELQITGRSKMSRQELESAIQKAKG